MDPIDLRVYKVEIFTSNVSRANRTVKFSRVLAAIDYAPHVAMMLIAAVLSIICIFLYLIILTKYPAIFNFLVPFFFLVHESLWAHLGARYMNFALALTCVFTGILCAKLGGFWWMFFISLFILMAFIVGRILKVRRTFRYPSDELQDVSVENVRRTRRIGVDDEAVADSPQAGPSGRIVTRSISRRQTAASHIRPQN